MRTIALLCLALACIASNACTFANADTAVALGGKGAYKGKTFALTWDNEQSFRDGSMVAGVAIGAAQAVALQRSADSVSKVQSTNASNQAINASNNATKVELGAQQSGLETVKATTIPK